MSRLVKLRYLAWQVLVLCGIVVLQSGTILILAASSDGWKASYYQVRKSYGQLMQKQKAGLS